MKFLVVLALVGFAAAQQNKYSGRYVFDLIKPALTAGEVETLLASRDASYPTYNEIPQTSFQCGTRIGFYADVEAQCQVFHRCDINGNQTSYLCVNTTVFNQITLVCDAWYNVDCAGSAQYEDFANSRLYTDQQLFDSPPADYIAPSQLLAQQQQEQLNAQGSQLSQGSQSSGQQQGGQQSGNQQASGSRGGASQASRGNANTQAGRPAVNANAGAQAARSNKGSMTLQSSGFASSAGRSDTTQEQGADQTQSGAEQTQGADQTFNAQGRSDTEQGQSQQAQGTDQSSSASQSASAEERSDAAAGPSTDAGGAESSPAASADQSSNAASADQSSNVASANQSSNAESAAQSSSTAARSQ